MYTTAAINRSKKAKLYLLPKQKRDRGLSWFLVITCAAMLGVSVFQAMEIRQLLASTELLTEEFEVVELHHQQLVVAYEEWETFHGRALGS